ncbi:MAG TPA: transaldolase family protein [Ktedonobacteraceae bacterium]
MALYVDTAFLDDITHIACTIPLAGITTNPTILLAARQRGQNLDRQSLIVGLLHLPYIPNGLIFMQPGSMVEEELFQEALTNWQIAQPILGSNIARFIHKIPMTQAGMRVARQLQKMQPAPRIAFTAVTTAAQAYTAAMAGADFVIPYFNRLERSGVGAGARIAAMATLLHKQHLPTRILAASIKSPSEAVSALSAGAHDITAAPQVLLDMVSDPQTDEAIEKFALDWQKMKN